MKTSHSLLKQLSKQIKNNEAFLISDPNSLKYFANCETLLPEEREAYLIINPQQSYIIQSSFSPKNNHKNIKTLFGMSASKVKQNLELILKELNLKILYIDKNSLFISEYENLQSIKSLKLKSLDKKIIWDLRSIKNKKEKIKIKKACQITKQVLKEVIKNLQEGVTELEIKREIIKNFYALGADGEAFPTIVAFAANSALPHHQPLDSPSTSSGTSNVSPILRPNMPVLIDCAAMYEGYRADMTRTIWFGDKPSEKFLEIEKIIMAAYKAALAKLNKPSPLGRGHLVSAKQNQIGEARAQDLDNAARSVISTAGYASEFIHSTGHGIGLEVHEPPSLNSRNTMPIKPGMVITIEPGIYLENQFGYRYENTVLVKEKGVEELTR
ncbi:MAG: M24 family metallopeptidase [Patescibacteria group bacterium]